MADIHILVADDSSGQRLDAYLGANDGCPTRSACAHLIEVVVLVANVEGDSLGNHIRTRTLDRRYITLVHGHIAMDEGTINTGIARSTRDRVKMAVSDDPFARQAITTFKVLERFDSTRFDDGYTLVECHLFTGRTHQIRVHMRHINHACVGDPLYGKCDARADQGLTRQFLHSWRVAFDHPVTGERIECRDELPWDLAAVLDDLAPRSLGRTEAGDEIVPQLGLLEALSVLGGFLNSVSLR